MSQPVINTDFPKLRLLSRGKVRDIYDLGDLLLIVTTDRVSAFDVVMPTPIPDKGKILTQVSAFWFEKFADLVDNHMISTRVEDFPAVCHQYAAGLEGRSMLVKKAQPLPAEAIVRGYLVGSGWKDYQKTGCVCGISLPPGLREAERLKTAIFTPSTKAEGGDHDENISLATMVGMIGDDLTEKVKNLSLGIYIKASLYAAQRGILLADTKFEFGLIDGTLILIDEVLTPDSSRFWPADQYEVGCSPPSFDKQYLRDYLVNSGWDPSMPPPELPPDVVANTRTRYIEALEIITGRTLN
jgi:phosphoribosylaminoimidazole-succinocarboxamide synthase